MFRATRRYISRLNRALQQITLFRRGDTGGLYEAARLDKQFTTYSSSTNITAAGDAVGFVAGGIPASDKFLLLDGTSGCFASTPDSAALDITGDIDIRVEARLTNWVPNPNIWAFAAKYGDAGNRSFVFQIIATGELQLVWSSNGTAVENLTSTVATGIAASTTNYVRFTRDSTTGEVIFYTSANGTSWTTLGLAVAGTAGAIFNSSAPFTLGSRSSGTVGNLNGRIYSAQVYASLDGTDLRADFNPARDYPSSRGTTMVSSTTGETYTINGTAMVKTEGDLMQQTSAARPTNAEWPRGGIRNLLRNSMMTGAASPSTLPTNFGVGVPAGLTYSYSNPVIDTDGGVYIDWTVSGTPSATTSGILFFTVTNISAILGQNWTTSCEVALVGGALTNVGALQVWQAEYTAANAFLIGAGAIIGPSLTSSLQRFSTTRTLNRATVGGVRSGMVFTTTASAAINMTLRLKLPQTELGSSVTAIQRVTSPSIITQSGTPSVRGWYFDGTDDRFTLGVSSFGTATSGLYAATGNNWSVALLYCGFATAGSLIAQCGATDANQMFNAYLLAGELQTRIRGTNNDSNTLLNDGQPHLLQWACTDGVVTLRIDGGARATLTAGAAAAETNMITVMCRTNSSPAAFTVGRGVPFFIDRALSEQDELQYFNQVAAEYGI